MSLVCLQMEMSCILLFINLYGLNDSVLSFSRKFYRLIFFFHQSDSCGAMYIFAR